MSEVSELKKQIQVLKKENFDLKQEALKYRDLYNSLKKSQEKVTSLPPEKNPWRSGSFNLTRQMQILKENPELAKQLQKAAKTFKNEGKS